MCLNWGAGNRARLHWRFNGLKGKFLAKTGGRFKDGKAALAVLSSAAFWFFTLVYLESLLHILVFEGFTIKFGYVVGFSAVFGAVLAVFLTLLPKKVYFPVSVVMVVLITVFYGSQMVYDMIFGTLYSVSLMGQGAAAITSFWREMLLTMWENFGYILLMLLPLAALILWRVLRKKPLAQGNGVYRVAAIVLALVVHFATTGCLKIGGTGFFSDYDYYHSNEVVTNQLADRFGLLTAFRLELVGSGGAEDANPADEYYIPQVDLLLTEPNSGESSGEELPTEPQYNILNIDFDELNGKTENETIQAINNYCAQLTGTKQNEYTGMLKGYNLIVLCGESFSTAAIHPELTPTLYKLSTEGIIFNNYYNSFPNTTTDGEYSLCLGLFPDSTRGKSTSSLYTSRNSYLPFALGNIFAEQAGVASYGYHNYVGTYYGREESHPNMGYTMKFAKDGMEFSSNWPASDLEMMEQSVDDYIGQEQFNVYYMTFSGHYAYTPEANMVAKKNWDIVKKLDLSYRGRGYLSCHIELDNALKYLMERLEEEGVLDRTAIVLAGDHFPYGVTDGEYEELVGYDIDRFTKYKSTLIFWVGGLEENIVVDEYCCNVDILPTILNLWGFEYDSRMLAGTDVFSDGLHMAVLIDKSFLTEHVRFDATKGKVTYLTDEAQLPEGYVDALIQTVKTKFKISSDILNTAYYNFVFDKGEVEIGRDVWHG